MQETRVQAQGWEDPLEKEMAIHSSTLAWKNLMDRGAWQATVYEVARVGHDLATKPPHCIAQGALLSALRSPKLEGKPRKRGYMCARTLTQLFRLCNTTDCSPPGSSVPGISQARILEWVAISPSRGSSRPRDQTCVSCIGGRILYH